MTTNKIFIYDYNIHAFKVFNFFFFLTYLCSYNASHTWDIKNLLITPSGDRFWFCFFFALVAQKCLLINRLQTLAIM